jgi:hypothetical protein
MVTFKDIEKSFEAKFAHDEELKFKAHARCNRMIGEWAAQQLNLTGPQAEAYAKDLVMAEFERPGTDAVFKPDPRRFRRKECASVRSANSIASWTKSSRRFSRT